MQEIAQRIQREASRLLQAGEADLIIGYRKRQRTDGISPCFVSDQEQVAQLTFDQDCTHNLARYLVGPGGYLTSRSRRRNGKPRIALVATPTTLETIAGLIRENQLQRQDVFILGLTNGVPPSVAPDVEVGHVHETQEERERILAGIEALEHMEPFARWMWWQQVFARCIRCYACRQVCPFCYCEQCIADENQPQWIDRSPSRENNRTWNIIRAFHLVGRCTGCGECERVCPVGIPLSLINTKMAAQLKQVLDDLAVDPKARSPMALFRPTAPVGAVER